MREIHALVAVRGASLTAIGTQEPVEMNELSDASRLNGREFAKHDLLWRGVNRNRWHIFCPFVNRLKHSRKPRGSMSAPKPDENE